MTPYQKYQLQWMIDHDKSLDDLIHELHEYEQECEEKEPLPSLYHLWIQDSGFNGELFISESEYKDYEGANTEDEEIQNAFKEFLLKEYPSTIIDYYWDQNEQLSSDDLEKILELAQTYKMTFIDAANEYLLSANEPFQTYEYESEIINENIRKFYDTHLEFPRENAEDLMLDSIFYNTISFNCNIEQLLRNSYPSDLTLYFESDGDIHDNFVSQVSDDYTTIDWLLKTQGYTRNQLFQTNTRKTSKFLTSLYEELYDFTTELYNMELIAIPDTTDFEAILAVANKNGIIRKTTSFGLFDKINGGGSGLNIELEKDIHLDPNAPLIEVKLAICKEPYHYTPEPVYGLMRKYFSGTDLAVE